MRRMLNAAALIGLMAAPLLAVDVQGLADSDEKVRVETSRQLVEQKAAAVADLLTVLDGDNPTAAKMADQTLFRLVQQSAGTADQPAVAAALTAGLAGHKPTTQRQICRLLGFVGTDPKAVEVLARALGSDDLREAARRALCRIPDQRATAALVEAMTSADEAFKPAIISGLGQKGDASAADPLIKLSTTENEPLRRAVWSALARIPAGVSVPAFTAAVKERKDSLATAELLNYADTLLKAGMLQEADQILKLRKEAGPLDALDQCRMLRAHARLGTPESNSLILGALDQADPRIRGAALQAAALLPGTEVTRVITQKMNMAKGQAKLDLLEVLGKRGAQMDDRTVMLMYMAMLDKDENVKIACIRAMENAGVTSTLPTLLNLVRGQPGPVADAAEHALARTPGEVMTRGIIEALPQSTPQGRARLLNVLAYRADRTAVPAVIRYAEDADAKVRQAAYHCLGKLGAEEAYETLLAAFDGAPGSDRDAAEQAMMSLKSDLITARLLSGYFSSSDRQKPSLLRVLARRQLEAIDALLMSESKSPDEQIRQAAIQGMCVRAKPALAATLLEAATTGPAPITAEALKGYLNIAASVEESDKSAAAAMYVDAFKLAHADEQRKPALAGIARLAEPYDDLVGAIVPLITEGNARAEAAMAVASLAARMPEARKEVAKKLLSKVLTDSQDVPARRLAVSRLRELGVPADPARDEGFVTCWWLLGPVDRLQDQGWDQLPSALAKIDTAKPVTLAGKQFTWKKLHTPDPQGAVDLIAALGSVSSRAAYAYAEVTVETAQDALLKIGSDDGVVVWVNGEKVHAVNEDRGLKIDQDTAKVSLTAGKNTILARIQQGGGEWEFCLRVATTEGRPVPLRQRME